MATYYFPASAPAKIIKVAGPNPPSRSGWKLRAATEAEQEQIDAGQTYWTPESNGSGTLSTPPAPRWKVTKDTLTNRFDALGLLGDAAALLAQQTAEVQLRFHGNQWFWNDNAELRAFCVVLQADPDVALARDPAAARL